MRSDLGSGVGATLALALMPRRNRWVKRRLLEATVGCFAHGENMRVVSYAVRGNRPAIICWEAGVLAVWIIVILGVSLFVTWLIVGFFCALALWIAHLWISLKWVGVVLTDQRLILFRQAVLLRRLRGVPFDFKKVMLEVLHDQMSLRWSRGNQFKALALILAFDHTVGHAPIRLVFPGYNQDEAATLYYTALPASKSGRTRPTSSPSPR
jgi:hypothetical protein